MSRMWYCSTISYNGPSTTNKSDRCFSLANSTVPHWWMALKMTQVTTMTTHTPQHTPPPIFVRVSLRGGWCTARPLYGSYYMPPQTNTQNYQLPAHYKQTLSQPPTSQGGEGGNTTATTNTTTNMTMQRMGRSHAGEQTTQIQRSQCHPRPRGYIGGVQPHCACPYSNASVSWGAFCWSSWQ